MRGLWSNAPIGDGELTPGVWGAARVLGVVPVPVVVTDVGEREWTWRFGLARVRHRVERRRPRGCRLVVELGAPWPLERALALAWGPVFAFSLRRLARAAASRASRTAASE